MDFSTSCIACLRKALSEETATLAFPYIEAIIDVIFFIPELYPFYDRIQFENIYHGCIITSHITHRDTSDCKDRPFYAIYRTFVVGTLTYDCPIHPLIYFFLLPVDDRLARDAIDTTAEKFRYFFNAYPSRNFILTPLFIIMHYDITLLLPLDLFRERYTSIVKPAVFIIMTLKPNGTSLKRFSRLIISEKVW